MAEKFKLGELEFDTEKEYMDATDDLRRIKGYMSSFNTEDKADAAKLINQLKSEDPFKSDYGRRFAQKLEKTAGVQTDQQSKKAKKTKAEKIDNKEKKQSLHIFTKRNIIIGLLIIIILVVVRVFFWPFGSGTKNDQQRQMVLEYTKIQLELKDALRNYYKTAEKYDSENAAVMADGFISESYVLNLTEQPVYDMNDDQISEIYVKLLTGGDLDASGFNEPASVTEMKQIMALAVTAGTATTTPASDCSGTGAADSATASAVVNKLMAYQKKTVAELKYGYAQAGFSEEESLDFAREDAVKIFGHVIYDAVLNDSEKQAYYEDFVNRGVVVSGNVRNYSAAPGEYGLPELTPSVNIEVPGATETTECVQLTVNPAACVVYSLKNGSKTGCVIFRANGPGTNYVQTADGTGVATQGDAYIYWNGELTEGEWFHDNGKTGLFIDGSSEYTVENVYDIAY